MGSILIRHDPASAALVRQQILRDLTRSGVARDSIDDVLIIASELVANAIRHTPAPVTDAREVGWEFDDRGLVIRVTDTSKQSPIPRVASPEAATGRGLAIVAALASEWGFEPTPEGKHVWARVPVQFERTFANNN